MLTWSELPVMPWETGVEGTQPVGGMAKVHVGVHEFTLFVQYSPECHWYWHVSWNHGPAIGRGQGVATEVMAREHARQCVVGWLRDGVVVLERAIREVTDEQHG